MKQKKIIITSVSIIIISLICFFSFKNSEKVQENKKIIQEKSSFLTKTVYNRIIDYKLSANGHVCEPPLHSINFEVEGNLENGELLLEPGVEFKKNQLLYRINNKEAFSQLSEKKNELAQLFKSILPQIEAKFEIEKNKWLLFVDEINPIKRLPELPSIITPDERVFLIEKGFIQAYVKTTMLEKEMEKYFYLAPFDGKFISESIKIGELATAGTPVAILSENTELRAKILVNEDDLDIYKHQKHVHFVNKKGGIIGNGKLLRVIKKKRNSHNIEVIYTVQTNNKNHFKPGNDLRIISNQSTPDKSVEIPYSSLNGNQVKILEDEKPVSKTVTIIGKTPKHYFIVGLMDGDKVIIE